jgi:magnesium-transporting ATPase (P-type)
VKYIFADKTGTLTKNKLTFVKCSVNRKVYSPDEDAAALREMLIDRESGLCPEQLALYRGMFLGMALCHTVIPQVKQQA